MLEIRHLSKTFDGVRVVRDVSLTIEARQVRGLVGPNGCGKSTIIKILSGFHRPDPGTEILWRGEPVRPEGISRGDSLFVFVHQDLALVPTSTVVENLALGPGFRTGPLWRIRWRQERRAAAKILEEFGIRAGPETPVSALGAADKTLLAIARALTRIGEGRQGLLVLDEPTSSLAESEVRRILPQIRRVAETGSAVMFVSHRLDEVLEVCDHVSVMRDGQLVADRPASELTKDKLIELMLGKSLEDEVPAAPSLEHPDEPPILSLSDVSGRRLRHLDIRLHPGEIVGVTGLLGSGKTELGRLVAGADRLRHGTMEVGGKAAHFHSPADAIRAGIAYVPPERRTQGGIPSFDAVENVVLPGLREFFRRGFIRDGAARREVLEWMQRTDVRPLEPGRKFAQFSGGNQQKLVFSKAFRLEPRILVLDEPTQGVDVGAAHDLYALAEHAALGGLAVLLLSQEWEDIARICHRVVVLERGRTTAELRGDAVTYDRIAAAVFGSGRTQGESNGD